MPAQISRSVFGAPTNAGKQWWEMDDSDLRGWTPSAPGKSPPRWSAAACRARGCRSARPATVKRLGRIRPIIAVLEKGGSEGSIANSVCSRPILRWQSRPVVPAEAMSASGRRADNICSYRAFRTLTRTRSAAMSAIAPLLGDERTCRGHGQSDAVDPGCVKTPQAREGGE